MTKAKRMLSLLLAVIMILSVMPITASAAENDGTTGGIKTDKTYNKDTGYLTLEAYVTGESQTQIVAQPVDIALVLDVSGSMDDNIKLAEGPSGLDTLDKNYGAIEGFYTAKFQGAIINGERKLRYKNGVWQYYKWIGGWTDIGSNHYDIEDIYISKLNALKIATRAFVDSAMTSSDPAHPNQIAIVSYADEATTVKELTAVNAAGASALKSAIDSLDANGSTAADYGMQRAKDVLSKSADGHKKVVIMFTDGEPNHGRGFVNSVATDTIKAAYDLKHSGASVYSVGVFNSSVNSKVYPYMNLVSSNYPDAQSFNASADATVHGYFMTSDNSAGLTNIFQTISQEIGGASVTLTETTVLKDTISDYFNLDESVDGSRKIEVHTETCTAIDADGNPTAWQKDNDNTVYNVKTAGKTITVEGFDYSANWVGSHNGQPGGKKIVLRIPIKPIDEKCWGLDLPTNDAANSGIYVDGKSVAPFPVPTANFPYYEIVHVRMGADGQPVYTGDQTNQVIADPAAVNAANRVRITDNTATVDLTKKVPNGYLYGGSFSDPACTTPWSYGTESAKSFRPQNGATYYIWEAPVDYLVPKSLSLSKTIDGQPNVIGFYLLTGVDRLYYQSAGFDVTDGSGNPISITDVGEAGGTALNGGSGKVYQSLTTVYTNGSSDTYKPGAGVFKPLSASSYLACFSVPSNAWAAKDRKVVFTPYWITLDGMKVTGTTTRTCQSDGPGSRMVKKIAETVSGSTIMPANTAVQMLLTACGNVAVDGSENAPSASVDPIDPVVPIDPIDPVTPVDPVDPVEPAKQFSVTVYDGGSVYTLSAEAGEDISSRLVSAGMHGMRFAGWFLDERSTAAAELKNVQGDMDVYAKYVSDTYLTLRYRNVGLFRSRNVKLYAALDSTDYAEAGFVIDGKAVSCPITKDAYTAFFLYGSTVREDNTLVSYTYGTSDLRYGDTVEITPYWVTLDGTTVYGTTQTLTYGRFGLM